MEKALYKRDVFVTAWDLNASCRKYICKSSHHSALFARLKRYARKHQRTELREALRKELREAD